MTPDSIAIHHSATPDGATLGWTGVRKYHTSYRHNGRIVTVMEAMDLEAQGEDVIKPWSDIGYHFGIEWVNYGYEILTGRMMNEVGAHCPGQGFNHRSIGICVMGNFDKQPVPPQQWELTVRFVRSLCEVCRIPRDRVFGHREAMSGRTCPGKYFDMAAFRNAVAECI